MVKRGIGAVVLAVIAALLLGYLLKDKSRERQEVVDMKLPGAPEINIPSLSEATSNVSDSAIKLVEETKEKVSDASNAVVASASGTLKTIGDSIDTASDKAKSALENTSSTASNSSSNPGFSFRPPQQNEEKEIVDNVTDNIASTSSDSNASDNSTSVSNDTIIASSSTPAKKVEPKFKPVIETDPAPTKKVIKKATTVTSNTAPTKKTAPGSTSSAGGKYSIQLLATSSQSRANKLAKTMTGEGYIAFITQTSSNNKKLYRVRIGGHNERSAAIKAQETMKRRYLKNFFVQNSLVVSN